MSNFVIVWTVLISIFYLNSRYSQEHFLGCVLIIMSGLVSVLVNLQTADPPIGQYRAPGGSLQQSSALWYVIYIIGTVPSGISNCYKQKVPPRALQMPLRRGIRVAALPHGSDWYPCR